MRISDWSSDVCSSDLAFLVVRAAACAETLPQLCQRPQRLRLGFAQQAAMNHGLAVAVERDDGTGHGANVRGVVAQTFLDGLQFPGPLVAPFFQRCRLVLVLGVVGSSEEHPSELKSLMPISYT